MNTGYVQNMTTTKNNESIINNNKLLTKNGDHSSTAFLIILFVKKPKFSEIRKLVFLHYFVERRVCLLNYLRIRKIADARRRARNPSAEILHRKKTSIKGTVLA